jgi:hypothetical protein
MGYSFRCIVANFSEKNIVVRKGQILGTAEPVHSYPVCAALESGDKKEQSWDELFWAKLEHLSGIEKEQLIESLRPLKANVERKSWKDR